MLENGLDQLLSYGIDYHPDTLARYQQEAERIFETYQAGQVMSLVSLMEGIQERSDTEQAINHYLEALDIAEKYSYSFAEGLALEYLGKKYRSIGEYKSVETIFMQALTIWEQLGDLPRVGHLYNNLALEAERKRNADSAIYFFEKGKEIFSGLDDFKSVIATNEMLARSYMAKRDSERAVELGKESIALSESLEGKWQSSALQDLAIIYSQIGDLPSAISHFGQAFAMEGAELLPTHYFSRFFQARCYYRTGEVDKAEKGMQLVLSETSEDDGDNYKRLHADIYELLSTIRQQQDNYEDAIALLKKREHLLRTIQENNRKRDSNREADKYRTFRAQQVVALEQSKTQQQARIKTISIVAGSILLILLLMILLLYRQKRNANHRLENQNSLIRKNLEERESLLKEIHHRVKNNLQIIASLLYLQSGKFENEDFKKVFEEGQGRVRSMALIHQKLYENEDLKHIPFGEYLNELVHEIRSSFGREMQKIRINIDAEDIHFDVDTAVPLGLIVNELTTNAFKYAFEGKEEGDFSIHLSKQGENYYLHIADDGAGLPEAIDLKKTKSLGLRLVRMLSQQLEGDFDFSSENGTRFDLKFAA